MLINLNGQLLPANRPSLAHTNRAFRYGDALFESMRMIHGKILFLQDHLMRVLEGATLLGMCPRGGHAQAFKMLEEEITKLVSQTPGKQHLRIRLTLFRSDGGLYEPSNTGFGFLVEASATEQPYYSLNQRGLEADTFHDIHKSTDTVSNFKTCNSLIYVMAALSKKNRRLDDCIILNNWDRPVEFTSSNLFLIEDGLVRTPPASEGCIAGVMRKNLLEFLGKEGYDIRLEPLETDDLLRATEMFRCNMGQGIQWFGKFRDKVYTNKQTTEIFTSFQVHLDTFLFFGF